MEHAGDESIAGASGTVMASEAERDSIAAHFDVWQNPTYVYLPKQQSIDSVGSHSSGVDARDIILQEGLDGPAPVIEIQGMPGIGKTLHLERYATIERSGTDSKMVFSSSDWEQMLSCKRSLQA